MPITASTPRTGAKRWAASGNSGIEKHAAGGGRLGVGVREPGVQREQGHLDGEGGEEGPEEPRLGGPREVDLADRRDVEGAAAEEVEEQDPDQHDEGPG